MTENLIQIVDENDQPIKGATKREAQQQGLWHRIVRVLLTDSDGNLLLQRRGDRVLSPGCWDFSTTGHVDVGEQYIESAIRELQEEIGVSGIPLREINRLTYDQTDEKGRIFRRFDVTFIGEIKHEYDFKLEPNEVAEIRWFTVDEADKLIETSPEKVTTGLRLLLESETLK